MRVQGLGALVLAAGRSRRMGQDKARLMLGSRTALERVVEGLREAGAEGIVVVTAKGAKATRGMALSLGARPAVNNDPASGPLASVKAGLLEMPGDPAGFFVFPVDHAMVGPGTLSSLAGALGRSLTSPALRAHRVLLPVHGGRRGHPVCLHGALAAEILALPRKGTLRDVTLADPSRIFEVPVEDPWVTRDLDEPGDLELARETLESR